MDTFIMLKRSDDTLALLSNPNAFALLTIVAIRARRTDAFNVHSLNPGEALIGDYASCGLTRQQYRTALSKLEGWRFIKTKATNKGTIATLADTRIYDINKTVNNQQDNHQTTIKQPTGNHQATTNNNGNNENNANNDKKTDFPSVLDIPEFHKVWKEWIQYRTEIKKKLTPSTIGKQLKMLSGHPVAVAVSTIERSIQNSWQGLFPEKENERKAIYTDKQKPQPLTAETSKIGIVVRND